MSTLRAKLLEVFDVEYREHLEAIRRMLAALEDTGLASAGRDLAEATRRAHSLKGAARAVGLDEVEKLAHGLESLFIAVEKGRDELDEDQRRSILDTLDEIEDAATAGNGQAEADEGEPFEKGREPTADDEAGPNAPARHPVGPARNGGDAGSAGFVRVSAESLDRLLRSAGLLHADMLFQEEAIRQLKRIARDAADLERDWNRQVKRMEAALPAAEGMRAAAALDGAERLKFGLRDLSRRLHGLAQGQGRSVRSLSHHLGELDGRVRAARMVPAESVFGSFRKMVRDLAASEGKQVEVAIEGLDYEADRLVLQRVKDPLMHLLRNAVSHGIEGPAERSGAGKPPRGSIRLMVSSEHDRLKIVIEDDGRGFDRGRIARKAVALNRLSPEQAAAAGDDMLMPLVFEPGFSTADDVTTISGRGVGLTMAREAIADLQGRFDIASTTRQGTRIEMSLPVSVLSRRLLLVSFKDQSYALPAESVSRVLRVPADDLLTVEGRPAIRLPDATLPLVSIGQLFGLDEPIVVARASNLKAVVVRAGLPGAAARHLGVAVENLLGVNEFVVRRLDGIGRKRLWSGIIATPDGAPCLVLNVDAFFDRDLHAAPQVLRTEQHEAKARKRVLVVDDSITTRTLEKSILEAHGYDVRLSVDGRDALGVLRADPPDVVVSDIEMPHVNGFELVDAMKADAALSAIPVILVTSRADDADRERGLRLGADAYVVKQKFDQQELLRTISQVV